MGDIRTWLQANGLGKHADALAAHDVDFDILPEITEAELSSLGLSFGDRKRLLRAIRELEPSDRSDLPSIPRHAGRTPCADRAERRQLTVMFCDIVGSTELSQQLDPEDLRDVIRAYQDTAKVAIERFDGYVARYMGDGVLAYFGYPLAHEDDAERAVRAGLALVESATSSARARPWRTPSSGRRRTWPLGSRP